MWMEHYRLTKAAVETLDSMEHIDVKALIS